MICQDSRHNILQIEGLSIKIFDREQQILRHYISRIIYIVWIILYILYYIKLHKLYSLMMMYYIFLWKKCPTLFPTLIISYYLYHSLNFIHY